MQKLTIALLSGGVSSERSISISGGEQVYNALDKEKYNIIRYDPKMDLLRIVNDASKIDVALLILHGQYGEDGTIQGLLDLLNIPYQGSGVLGSATAMNKLTSKIMYKQNKIPTPEYIVYKQQDITETNIDKNCDTSIEKLGLPIVVKPISGGSSIGMTVADSKETLVDAFTLAFKYNKTILLEKFINGIELTCGVIGNDHIEALPVVEIVPDDKYVFFDYEAKYKEGVTEEICPARIDDKITAKIQQCAVMSHNALFCRGYSRTDMILNGNDIYVLETNTIPGMTHTSLLPKSAKVAGFSFSLLLDKLITLAKENR